MRGSLLLLISLLSLYAEAQLQPNWVNPLLRDQNYPSKDYYIGFISLSYQKGEDLNDYPDKLKSAARTALSESIFVSINSVASSEMSNVNGESEDRYQKSTVTRSSLEATGLETQIFIDEKQRVAYGFAFVKKRLLVAHYFDLLSTEMGRIKSALERTGKIEDKEKAYKNLMGELQALTEVKGYQDMLKYLDISNKSVLMTDTWKQFYDFTLEELDKLRNNENVGLKEASFFLVDKLKEEYKLDEPVQIGIFTYRSTGIPTEFSDYFGQIFNQSAEAGFKSVSRSMGSSGYVLSGSYWPGSDKVQIITNINYVESGEVVKLHAGGSIAIDKESVDELGLQYNLSDNKNLLAKNNDMKPAASSGGLMANISTQKGTEAVIFREGEKLELFVNVSRPSYLRVVNIWSDDQKFLLADNFYLNPEQTNQKVKLPLAWETSCPCGVEYIQLIAQDKPFEPLKTENIDGFSRINGPLKEMLDKNRGFKTSGGYYAESTIVLSTIK
ncbi:MAG: hypothetical protein ACJA08_002322 [Cyclobacteriaceae bacterium]|jgi:hypothetical protein